MGGDVRNFSMFKYYPINILKWWDIKHMWNQGRKGSVGCADTNKGSNFDYLKEECSRKRRQQGSGQKDSY